MPKQKTAAKKKVAAAKAAAKASPKFGSDIKVLKVGENNRKPGSAAHGRFESMTKYLKNNPKATVADIIANTSYKRGGFRRDVKAGLVKVSKPAALA